MKSGWSSPKFTRQYTVAAFNPPSFVLNMTMPRPSTFKPVATYKTLAMDKALAMDRSFVPVVSQLSAIALDRAPSLRSVSEDGDMHVGMSNISKSVVNPYWGREIPNFEELGLDPDKKYMLLRHPRELAKAAGTFNGLPILAEHKPRTADEHPSDIVIGSTGTDAVYKHPYLQNSLHFWTRPAIDAIDQNKQRELSCAYHYVPVMRPGVYEGQRYDGIMTQIRGNHVALVEDGRAGNDVVVADAMPVEWSGI